MFAILNTSMDSSERKALYCFLTVVVFTAGLLLHIYNSM
jgi:hypothetical protein